MDIISIVLIIVLIALTAFFVAAEFAIVKVRGTRIDQLVMQGDKQALNAKKVITHMDEYLSACQLGITVTALGIGWLGEPAVKTLIDPLFELLHIPSSVGSFLSVALTFFVITFLHVVVGELAPKTIAIQKAEAISLKVAGPLILFYRVLFPFIWLLNGSARAIVKMLGMQVVTEHEASHTEDELRLIMTDSFKSGEINQSELTFVNNVFKFDDRIAKEIMVPRTEMVTLNITSTVKEWLEIVHDAKYTRYPIYDGDKDHMVGFVNVKDLIMEELWDKRTNQPVPLKKYVKPIITVIDSIPIHDLLLRMQKERIHIAILLDEYGGTSGLVTVEDIIEELVGEIRDEFDTDEINEITKHGPNHYTFNGKVIISEVNDLLSIELDDDEVDTIGGWVLSKNFDIKEKESIIFQDFEFTVIEMEGHQILTVDVKKLPRQINEEEANGQ